MNMNRETIQEDQLRDAIELVNNLEADITKAGVCLDSVDRIVTQAHHQEWSYALLTNTLERAGVPIETIAEIIEFELFLSGGGGDAIGFNYERKDAEG